MARDADGAARAEARLAPARRALSRRAGPRSRPTRALEPAPQAAPPDRSRLPLLLAALIALATGLSQWLVLSNLKQLPSPLFGGDYTYQMACIRGILAAWNPMASCGCSGALPGYQPLYGTLVAAIIAVTHLPVERVMLAMSAVNHALSVLIVFHVASRRLGREAGLVTTALWAALQTTPAVRYTEFTAIVLVPLYFDALLLHLERPRLASAACLGVMLAALGYAHAVTFAAGVAVAGLSMILTIAVRARRGEGAQALAEFARSGLVVALGASLALGYWYRPIFFEHGRTSLNYTVWNGGVDLRTAGLQWTYALSVLRTQVWPLPVKEGILHALVLLGVFRLWKGGWRGPDAGIAIAATAAFLWIFHFFLSMPLLNAHFVPDYARRFVWQFPALLTAGVGIAWLMERLPRPSGLARALAACALIAIGAIAYEGWQLARDPATVEARKPLSREFASLQKWVYANTSPEDVVLSTNELSFAWSALTGRKALVTRRAQNDPYIDMDERNRDAALILYGNNGELRRQLLRRWNIRYVLWTPYWAASEFQRDSVGNLIQRDPMLYFANPEYDAALTEAGVQLFRTFTFVDPYLRGPQYPRFELTLVAPTNYERADHPWRDDLDASLREVWTYEEGGVRSASLYRVVPP